MREWEKASWTAGRTAPEVIDKVGRAIARRLEQLARPGERILFLAGKGHNGDDVRAARKHLGPERGALLLDVVDPAQGLEIFWRRSAAAAFRGLLMVCLASVWTGRSTLTGRS